MEISRSSTATFTPLSASVRPEVPARRNPPPAETPGLPPQSAAPAVSGQRETLSRQALSARGGIERLPADLPTPERQALTAYASQQAALVRETLGKADQPPNIDQFV